MRTTDLSLAMSVLLPEFEDCRSCRDRLVSGLRSLPGVQGVSEAQPGLRLSFDQEVLPPEELTRKAVVLGQQVSASFRHGLFPIRGMDCSECARTIEKGVARRDGIASVSVSFPTATMLVEYDAARVTEFEIERAVRRLGYSLEEIRDAGGRQWLGQLRRTKGAGSVLLAGSFMAAGLLYQAFPAGSHVSRAAFLMALVVSGTRVAWRGLSSVVRALSFDMYFLMTLACVGAACLGDWSEAAGAMFLFALGTTLEAFTFDRARGALRSILSLSPVEARVVREGRETMVRVEEVSPGERVVVRPGEKVPLDGVVVSGTTAVSESAITGEALPVVKAPGAWVHAGTLNGQGNVEVEARRPYRENTIARIIHLVEKAQAGKAPSQRTIDRFARAYTPVVLGIALLVATTAPLLLHADWRTWLGRALVLLVVACPCALVISTPVTVISAIAAASRRGVLVKGGASLEAIGGARIVAFDKTGTLTLGHLEVDEVIPLHTVPAPRLLAIAAALASRSEHPLSQAVLERARREGIAFSAAEDFESVPGKGARGRIEGQQALLGSHDFLDTFGVPHGEHDAVTSRLEKEGRTVIEVALSGQVLGLIALSDRVRHGAPSCVKELRGPLGQDVVLLSGDSAAATEATARAVGIEEAHGRMLPEDKVEFVRALVQRSGRVVMIGDGVNDAPALKEATVGVAMGAAGSDLAIESADIALMADDLSRVPFLVRLSRRTVSTIRANIVVSLGVKVLFLVLAVQGAVNLWSAVASDVGVSLLVTLNGMRLLRHEG